MKPNKTTFKQTEIGMIPEDWEVAELGTTADFQYGLGECAQNIGDYVYIRITDITPEGFLNKSALVFIKKEKVDERYLLKKGDILVARTGASFGKTYQFKENFKATYGGFLIKILFNEDKMNPNFYFQFSRSNLYWNQANNLVNGGAQPQFNANVLSKILIPCPPLSEQRAIAKILSSLDAKIELNQQMNKTLEEIGKAIFKRWFVDFEFPNDEGKPYKNSGGEMEYNEELSKEIPKGWKVEELRRFIKFIKGKKPSMTFEKQENGLLPQILIDVLDGGNPTFSSTEGMVQTEESDILMVMDGASSGRIARGFIGILGSTIAKLEINELNKDYVYYLLKRMEEDIKVIRLVHQFRMLTKRK